MTACIGWKGDTPCPLGDPFHGCKLAEDVTHGYHVCACGERIKAMSEVRRAQRKRQRGQIAAPESGSLAEIDDPGTASTVRGLARPTEEVRHAG